MFAYCSNLPSSAIPNFNTINITNMAYTFYYCSNLTNIPNFNTSNVINMMAAFSSCSNLVTIPSFNMINVINMYQTFFNCKNLSQTSINNIVASCANAINVINKSFTNIGITDETLKQYIQNAPRYSAAVANGWVL